MNGHDDHAHDDCETTDHIKLYGPVPENVVAVHDDDSDKFHAYRRGDLIVSPDVADRVQEELDRRVGPVTPVGGVGKLLRYHLPDRFSAEQVLVDLRSVLGRAQRASVNLNTVLSLGYHNRFHCPHPPQPVPDPGPVIPTDSKAGSGIRVALIDTGVAELDQLEGRIERVDHDGFDVPNEDPDDDMLHHGGGHGTFAAGLVLQNAPMATVVSLRCVESDGLIPDWDLAQALVRLSALRSDKKVHIVSLSLGGHTPQDMGLPATAEALRVLFEKHPGTVVVAAAGNDSSSRAFFPAAYKQVIAVGAVDRQGQRAWFSNGGWWVDACAPGVDVVSTFLHKKNFGNRPLTIHRLPNLGPQHFEGWASWSGSSFTAPQVAGAIAAHMSTANANTQQPAFAGLHSLSGLAQRSANGAKSVPELGVLIATKVELKKKKPPANGSSVSGTGTKPSAGRASRGGRRRAG